MQERQVENEFSNAQEENFLVMGGGKQKSKREQGQRSVDALAILLGCNRMLRKTLPAGDAEAVAEAVASNVVVVGGGL